MCSVQRVCQIRVFYLAWKVSDDFPQEVIDNAMKKKISREEKIAVGIRRREFSL